MLGVGAAVLALANLMVGVSQRGVGVSGCRMGKRRVREVEERTSTQALNSGSRSPIDAVAGPASKRKTRKSSGVRAESPRLPREKLVMVLALVCGVEASGSGRWRAARRDVMSWPPLAGALRCRAGILERPEVPHESTRSSRSFRASTTTSSMRSQSSTTPAKVGTEYSSSSRELGFDGNEYEASSLAYKDQVDLM